MTEFETATVAFQQATVALQDATLWTGYGQLAIAFVQTLILGYGVYSMRQMSKDRQRDADTRAQEIAAAERHSDRKHAENMQALSELIRRTSPTPSA